MADGLRKRGRFWHYQVAVNGRAYSGSTGATDKATARTILEQIRREILLGNFGIKKAPTLGAVAEKWIETRGRAVSKKHVQSAAQSLKALGDMHRLPVTAIDTATVEAWRGQYLKGHSASSANLVLRYLKLWARWAIVNKLMRELPFDVKPLKPQQRQRPIVPIERIAAFLEAIEKGGVNPQIPCAVQFALMLGLRESEVLNARWEWLKNGIYTVGGRTKSKKLRSIPVPAPLTAAIEKMLAAMGIGGLPGLGLIFPAADGRPHSQGWLKKALKRGGIDGLSMHRLRATFATLHLRQGTPLKEVQEMLGHANPATTLIYLETDQAEKQKYQAALWGGT